MKKIYFAFVLICTLINAQQITAQSNQYLHFDGVDDYTELINGASYVNGSNTITMAGWFYTDELIYGSGMMSIRGGGTGAGEMYLIQLNDGTVECRVITSSGLHQVVGPAGTIQAGVWQHIAWVFNETTVELFVDGVSIGSSAASGTFQSTDRPFTVGKCLQAGFNFIFKGRADEVSLWNIALTATEIQNMMADELVGDESGLQIYYKFNQGTPGGNNTNITQLFDISNDTNKHSDLLNFALMGNTSNFDGTLNSGAQAINFPQIPNKLVTDAPFQLNASATSGLPVSYEIVSGPATVTGDMVTLNGTSGSVVVKASQAGNVDFDPAQDISVSFEVLDPDEIVVMADLKHPLAGDVYAPTLIPLQVAVGASIDYPELFSIDAVTVTIDGTDVILTDHENGFYTGWWTPSSYGNFDIEVKGTNNYNVENTVVTSVNVVSNVSNISAVATDEVWVKGDIPSVTVEAELPSSIGAFDQITGSLIIDCPTGGCDPWDRVSSVEAQGKDGEWFEIIRYLTPYGVACESEIDLTDFASLLVGKTKFRVNLGTQGNGFLYTLLLDYQAGTPDYAYSTVSKLWYQTYQFGDMANLQPTEFFNIDVSENTEAAKIKLVSSGHGWGDNNTANAAEFHNDTHHIMVNNEATFEQNNWNDCNPNPDGCSPQNGTWQFDRAGWCPGSIAQFFDYDMGALIDEPSLVLKYRFDQDYVDFCHPNNPDCVTGTTCNNCDDGFNPHLIVSSYFITFGNSPTGITLGADDVLYASSFSIYPNPSTGVFFVDLNDINNATSIEVYDNLGRLVKTKEVDTFTSANRMDLTGMSSGIYLINVLENKTSIGSKKLIIE
ncbi:hypothetical protein ULMS_26880 [Patiriisocius marinistellae]|uniref:LamG-like jellyroll fold domain-containing protein n=1 Tax=Patiriisocius marinistellae TaxID=2494560 RepID=A0A5J4FY58_9FLAO|nr:LamG-like jellyroll fold domain-containing protein [Patiriisocius marinistellae]GEQ87180.1 hypothetical protein ULMS_26880 [Patiriisocius marinistellae]